MKHKDIRNLPRRERTSPGLHPSHPRNSSASKPDPSTPPDSGIPECVAQPVSSPGLRVEKWPALFKKDIGLLEAHMRLVTSMQDDMKSEMATLSEQQKRKRELEDKETWRLVCETLNMSRDVLALVRKTAVNLLTPDVIRDTKCLGSRFPATATEQDHKPDKSAAIANDAGSKGTIESDIDSDAHELDDGTACQQTSATEPRCVSEVVSREGNGSRTKVEHAKDFKQRSNGAANHMPPLDGKELSPNPYFIIDTKPTPVTLNGTMLSKSKKRPRESNDVDMTREQTKKARFDDEIEEGFKKEETAEPNFMPAKARAKDWADATEKGPSKRRSKSDDREERKLKRAKRKMNATGASAVEVTAPAAAHHIDYAAMEAHLHAEVEAGLKATKENEKNKKARKRKRESEGEISVKKKSKKESSDQKHKRQKADAEVEAHDRPDGKKDHGRI